MTVLTIQPGEGETLPQGPLTIRVLEDGSHTGHRLGIIEITMPAGTPGPPQHVHREHDETAYILSGNPVFRSGAGTIETSPGMLLTAPPGTPHTFANPGSTPAVMLCTMTPDRYIGYFRELSRLGTAPDPAAAIEIMSRYATEIIPPGRG